MSQSNAMTTPLRQEIDKSMEEHTNRGTKGPARAGLKGDDFAVVTAWFRIATEGKRPTVDALVKRTRLTEARVTNALLKHDVQQVMENTGHGVVDVVQLAVALRVANALEDYTQRWQSGEIKFTDIPRPFQDLAMEAYKSKIPETRAKMASGKVSKEDGKPAMEFSPEALRLLPT